MKKSERGSPEIGEEFCLLDMHGRAGSSALGLKSRNEIAQVWECRVEDAAEVEETWRFGEQDDVEPCLCLIRGGTRWHRGYWGS